MAPVPDDDQEKQPSGDDSELNSFSIPNLAPVTIDSDFSDDDNDNYPDTAGYTLLPQEPGNFENEDDSDVENDFRNDAIGSSLEINNSGLNGQFSTNDAASIPDNLAENVIQSEAGASAAPTVTGSITALHPEFLAKYPDGKVPAYMQVLDIPPNNDNDSIWKQKKIEKHVQPLDSAEENTILKAMSGFSLPMENIPDWAKGMSDEQWDKHIVQHIKTSCSAQTGNDQYDAESFVEKKLLTEESWTAKFPDS